jgi:hypothetical protein
MTTEEGAALVKLFHRFSSDHNTMVAVSGSDVRHFTARLMDSTGFILAIMEYQRSAVGKT